MVVSSGLYALIGVVIGGLLNGLVSIGLEWHHRRQERQTVARLLLERFTGAADDLGAAVQLVDAGRGPGAFSDLGRHGLVELWEKHESLFAGSLDPADWPTLERGMKVALKKRSIPSEMTDIDRKVLKADLAALGKAQTLLAKLAKVDTPVVEQSQTLQRLLAEVLRESETRHST